MENIKYFSNVAVIIITDFMTAKLQHNHTQDQNSYSKQLYLLAPYSYSYLCTLKRGFEHILRIPSLFSLCSVVIRCSSLHFSDSTFTTKKASAPLYFWQLFSDVSLANEKVLTSLREHSMSLWKLEFQVQAHYSVFLARRLHTSGWSISRVINKITLARFWQASVIAANELSTSKINQSREKVLVYAQLRKQANNVGYLFFSWFEKISDVSHTHTHRTLPFEDSLIHHINK